MIYIEKPNYATLDYWCINANSQLDVVFEYKNDRFFLRKFGAFDLIPDDWDKYFFGKGRTMTYISLAVAAVLVGIDQFTKWLAAEYVKPVHSINLISFGDKEWLNLTYQENTGAAFSILRDKQLFLIILTSIILLGVIIMMLTKRIKAKSYIWSFALIIAGGAGNLIDRIVNNYVVDFIDVRIINFAVFNFADICAVCGTILLIVFYMINEVKESKKKKFNKDVEQNSEAENGTDTEKSDTDTEIEKLDEQIESEEASTSSE